ncbi:electron transporter SenC [Reichenbachiella sp. 5M10]|uniref:SCO family protein n=1 Tax=Reichenbachiella sp. 5M10 TaxID=1889772 RepID=UPI000C15BA90|nr:SCO family protein [Reichenbachiella sp. 5M10]PIB36121.1 electron transporter SenC [Reichenbachiella sp. 5M10]
MTNPIIQRNVFLFIIGICCYACTTTSPKKNLPVLGRPEIVTQFINGTIQTDTLPHRVANFQLLNQDSVLITNDSLRDNIYVADFFFTSCPTICPVMKKQLLRVYDQYHNDNRLKIVSHTIDPNYDNVNVLAEYSQALGVDSDHWLFLTGNQDSIYQLGEKSYMVTAGSDEEAPGGFIHSGAFLLVDRERRIRGVYDGTMEEQVDLLLSDINILLNEEYK